MVTSCKLRGFGFLAKPYRRKVGIAVTLRKIIGWNACFNSFLMQVIEIILSFMSYQAIIKIKKYI